MPFKTNNHNFKCFNWGYLKLASILQNTCYSCRASMAFLLEIVTNGSQYEFALSQNPDQNPEPSDRYYTYRMVHNSS